jgi:hypothetical protein
VSHYQKLPAIPGLYRLNTRNGTVHLVDTIRGTWDRREAHRRSNTTVGRHRCPHWVTVGKWADLATSKWERDVRGRRNFAQDIVHRHHL